MLYLLDLPFDVIVCRVKQNILAAYLCKEPAVVQSIRARPTGVPMIYSLWPTRLQVFNPRESFTRQLTMSQPANSQAVKGTMKDKISARWSAWLASVKTTVKLMSVCLETKSSVLFDGLLTDR